MFQSKADNFSNYVFFVAVVTIVLLLLFHMNVYIYMLFGDLVSISLSIDACFPVGHMNHVIVDYFDSAPRTLKL